MKRRNFIKNIGKLSTAPLLLNGVGMKAFATQSMLPLLNCQDINERVLVILFLKGGNDGLNTIIPISQYDTYLTHRPTIGLPESGINGIINLDTGLEESRQVGIHPSMGAFKDMYESGQTRLIQGVGYPDFNQSHFKSTDLWLSGGDGISNTNNGWIGRFFENAYPGVHGSVSAEYPDPLGIQLGNTKGSLSFHDCNSTYEAINLSGQDPANLFGLLNGIGTAPHDSIPASDFGDEIQYIMNVENSTNVYGERITNVYNNGTNSNANYPASSLANQLKTVARMLSGGSQTKVFLVHKTGFDTHANQVVSSDTHSGDHAELLADVFNSVKAFHEDLSNLGVGARVVTASFSEFGRRTVENGSLGTDHGSYGPIFLFGDAVNPGITGNNFDLTDITSNGNLNSNQLQHDYRSVFKTLLQDWLGASDDILDPVLFSPYAKLPLLIDDTQIVTPDCYINAALPIQLSFFQAKLNQENIVELEWETASEVNHDYFEIERSSDLNSFKSIESIQGRGRENDSQFYETVDRNPLAGTSYYRLKSIDLDRTIQYSEIAVIDLKANVVSQTKIYPNPAIYDFNVVLNANKALNATLEIYTLDGKRILSTPININTGFNKFNIDVKQFQKGQYLVTIIGDTLDVKPMQLLIQ